MPDDLLHHVFGPQPYSPAWLVWAVVLLLAVIGWYAGVFVWTLPSYRLRRIPVARRVHARVIRDRFSRRVQRLEGQHRAGHLSTPQACAAISRTVRSFLDQATGTKAQYLHVGALGDAQLAPAAPLLTLLDDGQFNAETRVEVGDVSPMAQELIRSWT